MPQRGQIQFYDASLEDLLRKRCAGGESHHKVAERAVRRYLLTCVNCLPVLRLGEWCAIFDALNGTWMLDESWNPRYIGMEVHDSVGLGEKWDIDQAALVATLMDADYGTCLAIADASEQFWADKSQPEDDGWRPLIAQIVGEKHIAKEE